MSSLEAQTAKLGTASAVGSEGVDSGSLEVEFDVKWTINCKWRRRSRASLELRR